MTPFVESNGTLLRPKADLTTWFDDLDKTSNLLEPLRALNKDRKRWLNELSIPESKEYSSVLALQGKPADLYKVSKVEIKTRIEELLEDEKEDPLQVDAKQTLDQAVRNQKDWSSRRKSGWLRKTTTGTQSILTAIGEFLESFSGIAEIVKAADQQYGGLAYGTISILVSVARHKSQREDAIQGVFEELAHAFPRLDTLQKLKANARLSALVVSVFELTIIFCRETTEYFASRLQRFKAAVSPKELKMPTISQLRTKVLEISREIEVLMLDKIVGMERQLSRIELVSFDTNLRIRENESREGEEFLKELMMLTGFKLQANGIPPHTDVRKYKEVLKIAFTEQRRKHRSPSLLTPQLLETERSFLEWRRRETSSILLFGGTNWLDDDSQISLNWLSPAACFVGEERLAPQKSDDGSSKPLRYVARFFCHPSYSITTRLRPTLQHVVGSLVYQLAEQHPGHLRVLRQEIQKSLSSDTWRGPLDEPVFELVADMLKMVLNAFETGAEILLVIDRLDQCRWTPEEKGDELVDSMRALLDVIRDPSLSHIHIKILIVAETAPAELVSKSLKRERGRAIDWKVAWHQEEEED